LYEDDEDDAKEWEVFGILADEEVEAFTCWDEPCGSFVGGRYCEEDGVSVKDSGGGEYSEI